MNLRHTFALLITAALGFAGLTGVSSAAVLVSARAV